MNVIILDFDGPMLPLRSYVLPGNLGGAAKRLDPTAAAAVSAMAEAAGAKIVVSSSWQVRGRTVIEEILEESGIAAGLLHDDWATRKDSPVEDEYLGRADEILAWLARHPETERWVCLDDEKVNLPNAVICTFDDGLSVDCLERACFLLGIRFGDVIGMPIFGRAGRSGIEPSRAHAHAGLTLEEAVGKAMDVGTIGAWEWLQAWWAKELNDDDPPPGEW